VPSRRNGDITDKEKIEKYCGPQVWDKSFYVCGPPGMLSAVLETLKALIVPDSRIGNRAKDEIEIYDGNGCCDAGLRCADLERAQGGGNSKGGAGAWGDAFL